MRTEIILVVAIYRTKKSSTEKIINKNKIAFSILGLKNSFFMFSLIAELFQ